jgi:four helix bundle protein
MSSQRFQDLRVYQLAEKLADELWQIVGKWDFFAKDTVGKQIVRSADSIGANLAEGSGRGSFLDNKRFIKIARGSLYETQHWLRRADNRDLLTKEQSNNLKSIVDNLAPQLNSYLNLIGNMDKNTND